MRFTHRNGAMDKNVWPFWRVGALANEHIAYQSGTTHGCGCALHCIPHQMVVTACLCVHADAWLCSVIGQS